MIKTNLYRHLFQCLAIFSLLIHPGLSSAQLEFLDDFVWIYSSQKFVEEFKDRSAEDVDTNLKGAEAVAVRLFPLAWQRCHNNGGTESCVAAWQWTMDLYIDAKQDIGIEGKAPRQFIPWQNSLYFLGKKIPELGKHLRDRFALKGGKLYLLEKNGNRRQLDFDVFSYKRPVREGIALVESKISGDAILSDPDLDREVVFSDQKGKVLHRIRIPAAYWQRLAAYHSKNFPKVTAANWQGGEDKDPYIWAYSQEFARQYGLPPENIDTDMEGAQAIAYGGDFGGRMCTRGLCPPPQTTYRHEFYLPVGTPLVFISDKVKGLEYLRRENSLMYLPYRVVKPELYGAVDKLPYSSLISRNPLEGRYSLAANFYQDKNNNRIYSGLASMFEGTYMPESALQGRFVFADYAVMRCMIDFQKPFCQGIYAFPTAVAGQGETAAQMLARNAPYMKISGEFIQKTFQYREAFERREDDLFMRYYCNNGYDAQGSLNKWCSKKNK